jgi:LPS export ABC transporter permease LptF/LPS export ABC transporter permease LptG
VRLLVLDRYIVRELAAPLGFGCVLLTFFLVIDRIYSLTDLVITKGVPFYLVVQLLAFMLPSFLALTLPMAFLSAVLLAGGRLASDLEIVAFRAAGVSAVRLFRPVLLVSLVIMAATAWFTLVLNPLANREFQRQLFRIIQAKAASGLQERIFLGTFGDVTIYVEDVSVSQVALRGLLVSDERDPKLSRIITAREGRLRSDEANQRITLSLIDGAINEVDVIPGVAQPAADPSRPAVAPRYRYTRFETYDMSLPMSAPLIGAARNDKPERDATVGELNQKIAEYRRDRFNRVPYEIERHKRFALPAAALVFGLIAFPLAIRSHRGGRSIAFIGSLVILVVYYLLITSLEGFALRGRIPPGVAIWTPNVLFAGTGFGLLLGTAREWRVPAMPLVWRALERIRRALSGRAVRTGRVHAASEGRDATHLRDSTHIIDRYLVREYLAFMGLGLAVSAALFVMIDLLQTLDRYLRLKPPLMFIIEHFVYRLPAALHLYLPVVMLVATIFLFLTLSRYHELTALKAAGISLYRVSLPILGLGLAIAIGAGVFQELALPVLNERGEEVDRVKIRGMAPRHLQLRHRLWVRSSDSRFYRVELLHPGTNDMFGVTILELNRDFRLTGRLDARQAHWTPAGWELRDGAYREISPDGGVQTLAFRSTAVELSEEMEDFIRIQKPVTAMSFRELKDYIGRLEAAGFQIRKHLVELYAKLSFPLVNLVMVLVAIPLALQSPRGGRLFGIGLALGIMAGYLVVHFVALAFARADLLPPLIAAWTANIIFMGIGVSLLLRART